MLKKEPNIVFHHIPKCGGTSIVTGLILTYYPLRFLKYRRNGFPSNLNSRAASLIAEQSGVNRYDFRRQLLSYFVEKGDSAFISGHYPFDKNIYQDHQSNWNFVTLLRDPVARWYSEYFWNRYKNHDYQRTDLSLEEYAHTRQGIMNGRSFVNFFSHADGHDVIATQADIDEAIENLKSMRVIGLLEDLPRFKQDMKIQFGRTPIFWNRNSSPASAEQKVIPDENSDLHKKILEITAGDLEIYEAATNMIYSKV
jgi:hypothetical protein